MTTVRKSNNKPPATQGIEKFVAKPATPGAFVIKDQVAPGMDIELSKAFRKATPAVPRTKKKRGK